MFFVSFLVLSLFTHSLPWLFLLFLTFLVLFFPLILLLPHNWTKLHQTSFPQLSTALPIKPLCLNTGGVKSTGENMLLNCTSLLSCHLLPNSQSVRKRVSFICIFLVAYAEYTLYSCISHVVPIESQLCESQISSCCVGFIAYWVMLLPRRVSSWPENFSDGAKS